LRRLGRVDAGASVFHEVPSNRSEVKAGCRSHLLAVDTGEESGEGSHCVRVPLEELCAGDQSRASLDAGQTVKVRQLDRSPRCKHFIGARAVGREIEQGIVDDFSDAVDVEGRWQIHTEGEHAGAGSFVEVDAELGFLGEFFQACGAGWGQGVGTVLQHGDDEPQGDQVHVTSGRNGPSVEEELGFAFGRLLHVDTLVCLVG
jgi:hypothetical protein